MEELYRSVHQVYVPYQPPGHDIKHAVRTASLAKQIAKAEGYDESEAEAAGLLHDIGRTVKDATIPHAHVGAPMAREMLNKYTKFTQEAKDRIVKAIEVHSDPTTEGMLNNILQDADKLDGMGAVGISRAYNSLPIDYDPENILPAEYVYGQFKTSHDILALTMDWHAMLYTEFAKNLGKKRYEFMKQFVEEFKREVAESNK